MSLQLVVIHKLHHMFAGFMHQKRVTTMMHSSARLHCAESHLLHWHKLVSGLITAAVVMTSGLEDRGSKWDGLPDTLKNHLGPVSLLASNDSSFHHSSAF